MSLTVTSQEVSPSLLRPLATFPDMTVKVSELSMFVLGFMLSDWEPLMKEANFSSTLKAWLGMLLPPRRVPQVGPPHLSNRHINYSSAGYQLPLSWQPSLLESTEENGLSGLNVLSFLKAKEDI